MNQILPTYLTTFTLKKFTKITWQDELPCSSFEFADVMFILLSKSYVSMPEIQKLLIIDALLLKENSASTLLTSMASRDSGGHCNETAHDALS